MSASPRLSLVIPTTPPRRAKLAALLESIRDSDAPREALEVVLSIDAQSDAPLACARDILPPDLPLVALTQPSAGPAAARNRAIAAASGAWVLSLDDDMRLAPHTLRMHLAAIDALPPDAPPRAFLGRVDWPPERLCSAWDQLLAQSSMLFFQNAYDATGALGFRYFWSGHICAPRRCVLDAGGFNTRFPAAMHEDIELGWRLERGCGLQVYALPQAHAWHDHPLTPQDYLRREHTAGRCAAMARQINGGFHADVWGRLEPLDAAAAALEKLFGATARQALTLLEGLTTRAASLTASELQATYLAHLPLKRLVFARGYLDQPLPDWAG